MCTVDFKGLTSNQQFLLKERENPVFTSTSLDAVQFYLAPNTARINVRSNLRVGGLVDVIVFGNCVEPTFTVYFLKIILLCLISLLYTLNLCLKLIVEAYGFHAYLSVLLRYTITSVTKLSSVLDPSHSLLSFSPHDRDISTLNVTRAFPFASLIFLLMSSAMTPNAIY